MEVILAKMLSASLEVVRNALAVLLFIRFRTLTHFSLLYSYFIPSIQTGVPYSRSGNIGPLDIVFSASCLSPHDTLADLDKL